MTPRARIAHLEITEQDGGLLVRDTVSLREHTLHPLTAVVWKHADGQTTVPELARIAREALDFEITEDQIWAAIDVLTGAQLMEGRVAPPAGTQRVNRRDLLRTVATGSAAAAALGMVSSRDASAAASTEQDVKKLAAKEAESKVSAEQALKKQVQHQEEDAKAAAQKEGDAKARQGEQAEKKADQAAAEESRKADQQEQAGKHEANQERASKARPFDDIVLDGINWGNIGEGYAPARFELRGAHVSLSGLVEYIGEFDPPAPIVPGDYQLPDGQVITVGDNNPPEPVDVFDDDDDLPIETLLIGTLPENCRPDGTLVFTVPSDTLIGSSEVHVTAAGEILVVLDDETDEEMDIANDEGPEEAPELLALKSKGDLKRCRLLAQRQRALRRRRMKAKRNAARLKRKLLRKRARLARRHRCSDGKEVMLRGPSEVSLTGITFRVKVPA